jgi:hypothetical protein
MARTAGLQRIYGACAEAAGESSYEDWDYEIERFAELIAAAEREACAALCFQMWNDSLDRKKFNHPDAEDCAAAIRAMGQK